MIKFIDIFCTPYVINIANAFREILIELKIETNLFCRQINNEDIERCRKDKNLYMFLFCPQWIYSYESGTLPINKYFFYQLEQFDKSNAPHIKSNLVVNLMKNSNHIFDYSKINLDYYTNNPFNFSKLKFSQLIPPIPKFNSSDNKKEIDVLFVGSLKSNRRQQIISILKKNDINIYIPENCFGDELKNLISRAKIFLNIRFSDSKILETCRLHEALMSSNTFIVSENPGNENEKEFIKIYKNRIYFINEITNDCAELVELIKNILSVYDNLKNELFETIEINEIIKNTLLNVFNKIK